MTGCRKGTNSNQLSERFHAIHTEVCIEIIYGHVHKSGTAQYQLESVDEKKVTCRVSPWCSTVLGLLDLRIRSSLGDGRLPHAPFNIYGLSIVKAPKFHQPTAPYMTVVVVNIPNKRAKSVINHSSAAHPGQHP